MADATTATKHLDGGGGTTIVTDIKALFKTRRHSVTFAYGFMFVFVVFTVFLAFSPSPNSYSPLFSNIFSYTTTTSNASSTSSSSTSTSYGSQFASFFSHFFPDKGSSFEPQLPPDGSNTTSSRVPSKDRAVEAPPVTAKNATSSKGGSFNATRASNSSKAGTLKPSSNHTLAPPSGKTVNTSSNHTLAPPSGKTVNTSSNYTASLAKKQESGNGYVGELANCDLFDGEWVKDESYPLYKPGSCSLIDEQFNCIVNGRPDKDFQKYKWKPRGCSLPRLNAGHMLEMLRGKRLAFVGDSLNRNMWESMVCFLKGSVTDKSKVYEANGRHHFRGEASYSFVFKDYDCTVEFFVSPFIVQEWETTDKNGSKKETLRLDLVGKSSDQYKSADIVVFNTGHWWTHEKTSLGKDYYQEGSHVYNELNVLEAFRKALTTWARWVDANVNPSKTQVFFRGYSASHFSGGQWNSGGACDHEVEPIKNSTYLRQYPPKMLVLEKVMRGMKTPVKYLNITRMTDYRKDGHPSLYRKHKIPEEERRSPQHFQDCSHWCLPGVPDAWNEILYAELLINEYQRQQVQKRHR